MKKNDKELVIMTFTLVVMVLLVVVAKAFLLKITLGFVADISISMWTSMAVVLIMKVVSKIVDTFFQGVGTLVENIDK